MKVGGKQIIQTDYYGTYYTLNEKLHRDDGPAIEYRSGENHYYKHGNLHRLDGPAIDSSEVKDWYYEGKHVGRNIEGHKLVNFSQEDFEAWLKFKAFI